MAAVLHCQDQVAAFAFAPDGKHLTTAEAGGFARIYEVASGKVVHTLKPSRSVVAVAYSTNGKLLATMGQGRVDHREMEKSQMMTNQVVRLWNVVTGKEVVMGGNWS